MQFNHAVDSQGFVSNKTGLSRHDAMGTIYVVIVTSKLVCQTISVS